MVHELKRHPFAVRAFFRHSLVLTYAVPRQLVDSLLPPGLTADCHGDWGFVAVAMVQTENLRPVGLPGWLGQSFFLTGYRLFTRFHAANGKTLRGLKVIRSDTDRRLMRLMGNVFTHYGYHTVDAELASNPDSLEIHVKSSDGQSDVSVLAHLSEEGLPEGSVFDTPKEARRFAGPMPFTFDFEPESGQMVVIEGVRKAWNPQLVQVEVSDLGFLRQPPFVTENPILSSAFYVHDVDYSWKRGRVMKIADRTSSLAVTESPVS